LAHTNLADRPRATFDAIYFLRLRFSGRRGQRLQSGFDLQHFFLTRFATP